MSVPSAPPPIPPLPSSQQEGNDDGDDEDSSVFDDGSSNSRSGSSATIEDVRGRGGREAVDMDSVEASNRESGRDAPSMADPDSQPLSIPALHPDRASAIRDPFKPPTPPEHL